eukprot:392541_1
MAQHTLGQSIIYVSNSSFTLDCYNKQSCANSIIHSVDTDVIQINCITDYSCQNMQIFADDTALISLNCKGPYSCQNVQIYHHNTLSIPFGEFNVNCSSSRSCESAKFKTDAEMVYVDCYGSNGCRSTDIYCESVKNNCTIVCQYSSCYQTNVFGFEGIFDVNIVSYDTNADITLYCGPNYYESCVLQRDISNNKMLCDNNNYCMNYKYDASKDENIILLSDYQKYNETIQCSDYNNCNVYCFGLYSCKYSTIDCSVTSNCNVFCIGQYSCSFATVLCPENNETATCTIQCNEYSCEYSSILAHNISSLQVSAQNTYALQYASIISVNVDTVILDCNAASSCIYISFKGENINNININCMQSSSCQESQFIYMTSGDYYNGYDIHANFDINCLGSSSCRESVIRSNAGYLNVDCNSDGTKYGGCNTLSLYCPESSVLVDSQDNNIYCEVLCGKTDSCVDLSVYSINGWSNTRIWSVDDKFPTSATMYCNPAFISSCSMQGNVNSFEWYCDQSEICSNYKLDLNATQFITARDYHYYNKTLFCTQDQDCYIYCFHAFSCQYVTVQCPNKNCYIYCDYTSSCINANIMAEQSDSLFIYSTANNALEYSIIYSPKNLLYMECTRTRSCQYETIFAQNTNHISLHCSDKYPYYSYSCYEQIIHADNCTQIDQICKGSYSCANSELYQYSIAKSVADSMSLTCDKSYSCTQNKYHLSIPLDLSCNVDGVYENGCWFADFYIDNEQNVSIFCGNEKSCGYIDIYSTNGFVNNNITIVSNYDTFAQYGKFYCGYSHDKYCNFIGLIDSDLWICQETEFCYDYVLNNSDISFIAIDYDYQHAHQFINCDQNKKNCEVKCNAYYGCWNSKIMCPINGMNQSCNIYCDSYYSCNG